MGDARPRLRSALIGLLTNHAPGSNPNPAYSQGYSKPYSNSSSFFKALYPVIKAWTALWCHDTDALEAHQRTGGDRPTVTGRNQASAHRTSTPRAGLLPSSAGTDPRRPAPTFQPGWCRLSSRRLKPRWALPIREENWLWVVPLTYVRLRQARAWSKPGPGLGTGTCRNSTAKTTPPALCSGARDERISR